MAFAGTRQAVWRVQPFRWQKPCGMRTCTSLSPQPSHKDGYMPRSRRYWHGAPHRQDRAGFSGQLHAIRRRPLSFRHPGLLKPFPTIRSSGCTNASYSKRRNFCLYFCGLIPINCVKRLEKVAVLWYPIWYTISLIFIDWSSISSNAFCILLVLINWNMVIPVSCLNSLERVRSGILATLEIKRTVKFSPSAPVINSTALSSVSDLGGCVNK
jgi:hypothetical protein